MIERADGSVCFRLARNEWSLAEEILHNLLDELRCEEDSRRDARSQHGGGHPCSAVR